MGMKKKNGKYILRESELKKFIQKAILSEMMEEGGDVLSFDELIDNIFNKSKNPQEAERKLQNILGPLKELPDLFLGKILGLFGIKYGSSSSGGQSAGDGSYDVESSVKQYPAGGGLNGKQATFVQFVYPLVEQKLKSIGKNPEFAACCTANAYFETGGRLSNGLAKRANNLTGIIAPGAQRRFGPGPGQDQPTGGVGGRPAVNAKPGVKGDTVWWYTKFSSFDDWAQYYVVELLDRQYGAFDDTLDKFGYHLFVKGRKKDGAKYGCNTQEQVNNYLNYLKTMVPKILAYVRSVGITKKEKTS